MEISECKLQAHLRAQLLPPVGLLAVSLFVLLLGLPYMLSRLPNHGTTWIIGIGLVTLTVLGRQQLGLWLWQQRPLRELRRTWSTCRFFGCWNMALVEDSVVTSLEKAARLSDDSELQQAVWGVIARLQSGQPLGQAFAQAPYFSPQVRECVMQSLETGQFDRLLDELWEVPEIQLCMKADRIVEIVTPLLLLLGGLLLVTLAEFLGQLL
jgi:type II secretory pathway component PulF